MRSLQKKTLFTLFSAAVPQCECTSCVPPNPQQQDRSRKTICIEFGYKLKVTSWRLQAEGYKLKVHW